MALPDKLKELTKATVKQKIPDMTAIERAKKVIETAQKTAKTPTK